MRRMSSLSIAAPIAILLLAAAPEIFSDEHDKKTDVTITEPLQVPGAVLQPGTYMFILLNSSSDRHIVEIKSQDGKHLYAMMFTAAARRVVPTGKVALTFYETPQGTPKAVRQWFWPGDYDGQEFLYSHKQAAEITAASHQTVLEVTDQEAATIAAPAPAASDSADLTASAQPPAPAPPADQAVQQIADQPVQQAPEPAAEVTVAQAAPPADNSNSNDLLAQNVAPTPAPQTVADNSDNSALPQTASNLPLVGLLALVSLASAVTLRLTRRGRA
jgi:hypothetical protein